MTHPHPPTRRINIRVHPLGCLLWCLVGIAVAATPVLIVLIWKALLT